MSTPRRPHYNDDEPEIENKEVLLWSEFGQRMEIAMPSEKARIEAELVGGAQVVGEANKIDAALGKVASTAGGKLGGALRTVGGALSDVIFGQSAGVSGTFLREGFDGAEKKTLTSGLKAAGVLQSISLANAIEDVKKLDLATAKLGQSAGVSGTQLKEGFDKAEKKTLTSAVAMGRRLLARPGAERAARESGLHGWGTLTSAAIILDTVAASSYTSPKRSIT